MMCLWVCCKKKYWKKIYFLHP